MAIKIPQSLRIPSDNWVYFHHTGQQYIIPVDPETLADSMSASFPSSTPLSRSAPIYSYSGSGPRSVQVSFRLHRDLDRQFGNHTGGADLVDSLITNLDQMCLPDYNSAGKIVNPPVVSLKIRDEIFIKGIVTSCSHTFEVPVINYDGLDKYAICTISFAVQEITPFNASIISSIGQYRTSNAS